MRQLLNPDVMSKRDQGYTTSAYWYTMFMSNGLPEYVINAESTNSFKNRLDNYWKMTGYGYLQRLLA